MAGCTSIEPPYEPLTTGSIETTLASLTKAQQEHVAERAEHVRQVINAEGPLRDKINAKAAELNMGVRTLERWVTGCRRDGTAELVDIRVIRGRGSRVDPRWDNAVRATMAEKVNDSTPSRSALLARASALLVQQHGPGTVADPSAATAYRRLKELAKGTNAATPSCPPTFNARSKANATAGSDYAASKLSPPIRASTQSPKHSAFTTKVNKEKPNP